MALEEEVATEEIEEVATEEMGVVATEEVIEVATEVETEVVIIKVEGAIEVAGDADVDIKQEILMVGGETKKIRLKQTKMMKMLLKKKRILVVMN